MIIFFFENEAHRTSHFKKNNLSQKRISPVESIENEPKPNSRKKGIFKLGGDKSQKSRAAIPSKYLPSALRKKRNDSTSKVETDSPLIQGAPSDDFSLI